MHVDGSVNGPVRQLEGVPRSSATTHNFQAVRSTPGYPLRTKTPTITHLIWPKDTFGVGTVAKPAGYEDGDGQLPHRSLDCEVFWSPPGEEKLPNVRTYTFPGIGHIELGTHKPAQERVLHLAFDPPLTGPVSDPEKWPKS